MKILKLLIILVHFSVSLYAVDIRFTQEEKEWISNNPSIKFGADYKWPPFDFVDEKGRHTGLASEYIKLVAKKSGLKIDVTTGVWSEILKEMKSKKYDGLTCAVETDERKKYLNFSDAYLSVPMVIITKTSNNNIKSIDDLLGKTVSINKGSYVHEWLGKYYPKINLHLTSSNEASLEAVSIGSSDAYVGNLAVSTYIINKYLMNNLKTVTKLKGFNTSLSIAIDKENTILFNIVQKTIASITIKEHQELKSRWKYSLDEDKEHLMFSKEQQNWINKHKKIRYVIDNHWTPMEFFSYETNKHSGLSKSYVDLVAKKTGIEFELVYTDLWSQSVQKVNDREADMFPCVAKTESREKILNFSNEYLSMPQVFVTNQNVDFIEDITKLYGKRVALVEGYYITEMVKKEHPEIIVIEVKNIKEAFEALTKNKAYAYIEMLAVASAHIQNKGFSNLKISGMSGYNSEFSIALRNDWSKVGIDVINMALDSITQKEKNNIYNKWLQVKYNKEFDYTLLWQIIAISLVVIFGTLYWNRKLSKEIKQRKLAQEELLRLNLKLEAATNSANNANKAKSDFLSNMSHEIRTPMNAILGFAELLDDKIEDKKLKSFIKTIRSSGQTLLLLINDILDLSKIESGKMNIVKDSHRIEDLFEEVKSIFQVQVEKKGLFFELIIDENIPEALMLDAVRLKEILINLVGNAIKFTDHGYIRIVVNVDETHEHTSKVDITVKVEDSGIGIDSSQVDKIFNIFEQMDNQDTKKYGGTGLGLAISRKLAQLMGGSLNVKSEPNTGSSFILKLINVDIASLSDDNKIKSSLDFNNIEFNKATILVVDDVEENRELIKEGFSDTNLTILEAKNGKEAIDTVKNEVVDLVLMDIRMPVMDGYTATRLIKEFSSIPIIALTASIMQDELKKLDAKRFDNYLRKPVSKHDLFKMITNYLNYIDKVPSKAIIDEEEIPLANYDELSKFLSSLSNDVDALHKEAISTNDFSVIAMFAKSLLELSTKHNIEYMLDYANLLLEKIDEFDIEAIGAILNSYKDKIKKLKIHFDT